MKLYLSSYRIPAPEALTNLIGAAPGDTRVALLPNAKDYYADRARDFKLRQTADYFGSLGYHTTEIVDLRTFDSADSLYQRLGGFDLIWAGGGNTFCLREAMQASGFETALPRLLADGKVYAGESAGAIVAGTSLRGIEQADEPAFAGHTFWAGLCLVDKFILPHVDNPGYQEAMAHARACHEASTVVALKDAEAYIVDGEAARIVASEDK